MKKDLLALSVLVFLLIALFSGTRIQSVEDYYLTHIDDIQKDSETVFLTVRCDSVFAHWEDLDPVLAEGSYLPQNGIVLARTEYVLRPGDTVYDILNRAMRYNKIPMECAYSIGYESVYVQGIHHLYEFSCGELSGWMYQVNGVFPNYGCSRFELSDKDEIVWIYTCDLGRDIGAGGGWQR